MKPHRTPGTLCFSVNSLLSLTLLVPAAAQEVSRATPLVSTGKWNIELAAGHLPLAAAFVAPSPFSQGVSSEGPAADHKWEIELHGGGTLANKPVGGTGSLPNPGAPFTTLVGRPSRRASSWYFGDGALLLNQVNAAPPFALTQRITPLDSVLNSSVAQRQSGGNFGFRISRVLSPRFTAEISFDYSRGHLDMSSTGLAGIEASRASFPSAWNGLISTGPFTRANVTSTSSIRNSQGRQSFITGTLNINLKKEGKVIPYVTLGGGIILSSSDTPSATLVGNYQFLIVDIFPVSETDTVNLRYSIKDKAFVGVIGGGLKYYVSPRWGFRLDVRAHLSHNTINNLVDANPAVATRTPAFAIASVTTPSMQFSNNLSTDFSSSLSGPPISGFQSFTGSGIQRQVSLTAGLMLRF